MKHGFLWAAGCKDLLAREITTAGGSVDQASSGQLLLCHHIPAIAGGPNAAKFPHLAFSRQFVPNAQLVFPASINAWAQEILARSAAGIEASARWFLHIEPYYRPHSETLTDTGARALHTSTHHGRKSRTRPTPGIRETNANAGRHRCELIRKQVLETLHKRHKGLLNHLQHTVQPLGPQDSLVQALLFAPDQGVISVANVPLPFINRHLVSAWPAGHIEIPDDKAAPSRAFKKLLEATERLGIPITAQHTCVDLGAAPGSWTYAALKGGASVFAVDRADLRPDLMKHPRVNFVHGDAFQYAPRKRVDWLLCDVIADPERLVELLLTWVNKRWCRHFIVTIKLKLSDMAQTLATLDHLKHQIKLAGVEEWMLTKLEHNKHEVCAFGRARE